MSMSCPANTALTDNELNQTYGNGVTQGVLPSSPNGASDRDGNGLLSQNTVQAIVTALVKAGIVPEVSPNNYELYQKKQADLMNSIKAEYCFYESRYKYALNKLFAAINDGYMNNSGTTQTTIQQYLTTTQGLNQRLNDLTQITNAITEYMLSSTTEMESEIKAFEAQIKELQAKLQEQNKIISSGQSVTELNKQMVKFTEEKAKYSNNLLGLYSFMNIVALGLLVYVYKSAEN